jgi:hypothetical protein
MWCFCKIRDLSSLVNFCTSRLKTTRLLHETPRPLLESKHLHVLNIFVFLHVFDDNFASIDYNHPKIVTLEAWSL